MLLYLAGLQTIPEELHEAAKVEGAGPIQRFLYVTFPLLRETTLVVLAITAINALKAYDIIYAMTNGGPANRTQLLSTWMYFLTYNYNQVGLGTAIAVILFSADADFRHPLHPLHDTKNMSQPLSQNALLPGKSTKVALILCRADFGDPALAYPSHHARSYGLERRG